MRPPRWILIAAGLGACGGGPPGEPPGPACVDPPRGPAWDRLADVTGASGIDFQYTTTGFQGGGLAVVDLDGDGLPEIVAGRRSGGLALFLNLGALRFEERADAGLDAAAAVSAIGLLVREDDQGAGGAQARQAR